MLLEYFYFEFFYFLEIHLNIFFISFLLKEFLKHFKILMDIN